MKLIACHINNFGKLSDLNINFNDGVNVINQPNGWGKSTLAAFLKAMLYGFDTKKEPGAFERERKLYKPWQGGTYGGELDFEADGVEYRLVRTFGLTEKQDDFHLYRLATMVECDDFSPLLGEELFDLDRSSFKRTIYIAQADCMFSSSDSISAKLGNMAENTNDINNFESATADIKDMMNKMSPNRITGSIKKRVNTLTALEQELKKYQAADEAAAQLSQWHLRTAESRHFVKTTSSFVLLQRRKRAFTMLQWQSLETKLRMRQSFWKRQSRPESLIA